MLSSCNWDEWLSLWSGRSENRTSFCGFRCCFWASSSWRLSLFYTAFSFFFLFFFLFFFTFVLPSLLFWRRRRIIQHLNASRVTLFSIHFTDFSGETEFIGNSKRDKSANVILTVSHTSLTHSQLYIYIHSSWCACQHTGIIVQYSIYIFNFPQWWSGELLHYERKSL